MTYRTISLALAALPLTMAQAAGPQWVRTWAASPTETATPPAGAPVNPNAPPPPGSDVTFRMVAHLSAGGRMLRLRLSNELSPTALPLGAVHVALAAPGGGIVPGSDRVVSFAGVAAPTLAPNAPAVSDPVALAVPAFADLVVSIHVPGDASGVTVHPLGSATTRILAGDQTAAAAPPAPARTTTVRYILSGVDVAGGSATGTIATIGDSITDGARSTADTNNRWPDTLARRLGASARFAIANEGISGNRLLLTGAGPAALARLDRDVFSAPNIRYLVVLEGINDIGVTTRNKQPAMPPEALIAAYRQIVERAHDAGVKVIGATITPYKGAGYYAKDGEATRQAVNAWIRAPGHFDGVIDFDRAVADPADPARMAPAYDSGDKLHPGDAGYRRMAESIDLKLFR